MAKTIVNVTHDTMETEVAQGVTLVDFWAEWCGPCKMVAPVLEELYEDRDDFKLVKLDVDAEPELAEAFGIQGIPTIIAFRDGKAEFAAVGAKPREFYEEMLDRVLDGSGTDDSAPTTDDDSKET